MYGHINEAYCRVQCRCVDKALQTVDNTPSCIIQTWFTLLCKRITNYYPTKKKDNQQTRRNIMIHEVKIQKSASSKKLVDYGIVLHRQKSSLHHSHLQIKSLGNQFHSTSIDENTDLSTGYLIVGVNDQSCRGLTAKQVEDIILKQKDDEVTLLIRGGDVTPSSRSFRGSRGDCVCAKGCEYYCAECCCNIQWKKSEESITRTKNSCINWRISCTDCIIECIISFSKKALKNSKIHVKLQYSLGIGRLELTKTNQLQEYDLHFLVVLSITTEFLWCGLLGLDPFCYWRQIGYGLCVAQYGTNATDDCFLMDHRYLL